MRASTRTESGPPFSGIPCVLVPLQFGMRFIEKAHAEQRVRVLAQRLDGLRLRMGNVPALTWQRSGNACKCYRYTSPEVVVTET